MTNGTLGAIPQENLAFTIKEPPGPKAPFLPLKWTWQIKNSRKKVDDYLVFTILQQLSKAFQLHLELLGEGFCWASEDFIV
jgi:hypothetical protein